jgi:FkbM family methyltransferase
MLQPLEMMRRKMGYRLPRPTTWVLGVIKRVRPLRVQTELFPRLYVPLDLSDDIQRCVFWQGADYERPVPGQLATLCDDASLFFDIGANFGYYSYYILQAHPKATVYSFEPNPRLYEQQVQACTLSRVQRRFFPQHLGLSDRAETLTLHISPNDSGHSTFGDHPDVAPVAAAHVAVTRFDDWRERAGLPMPERPSWVAKIDVEGYEPRVLAGMEQALARRAFKALCIEVNSFTLRFCGSSSAELYAMLRGHGYAAYDEAFRPATPQPDELRNIFFLPPEMLP